MGKHDLTVSLQQWLGELARINAASDEGVSDATIKTARKRRALRQQKRVRDAKAARIIAYDFETSRIKAGTPEPLYLTAYGVDPEFSFDGPVRDLLHVRDVLIGRFLVDAHIGVMFVAWYGNGFDAYFIAAALLHSTEYVIRPYLTKTNTLRGMCVIAAEDIDKKPSEQRRWEFLDGMAMLGSVDKLEKFLALFSPETAKLTDAINFELEEFDSGNAKHREYAMRDSVGLCYGMMRAQQIMLENFNQPLTVTIGNAAIKVFKANIPEDVAINALPDEVERLVRDYVMRGGFCYCVDRYEGPVWKYDLNQAYAAAMRESWLPQGFALHSSSGVNEYAMVYIARITARNPHNKIPFYYCTEVNGRIRSVFSLHEIRDTWLTSNEIEQLRREGWRITIHESYSWDGYFRMKDFVDRLERVRTTCEGGPSGPIGSIIKYIGCNAYGKTVSSNSGESLILSSQRPGGYAPYYPDGVAQPLENIWSVTEDVEPKDYEQPHIGAFITAHVRMVVRRAALMAPDAWLYADTDCVVFSKDVGAALDTDPKRYGAWKIEEEGTHFRIIAKKVYQNVETKKGNAKGLNVKRLTEHDFKAWFDGAPPVQQQVQRNNFIKVMAGEPMYRNQQRKGTQLGLAKKNML